MRKTRKQTTELEAEPSLINRRFFMWNGATALACGVGGFFLGKKDQLPGDWTPNNVRQTAAIVALVGTLNGTLNAIEAHSKQENAPTNAPIEFNRSARTAIKFASAEIVSAASFEIGFEAARLRKKLTRRDSGQGK